MSCDCGWKGVCVRVLGAATGAGPCFLPHSLPTRLGPFQHRGMRTAPRPPARRIPLPGADFNPPPGGVCVPRSPPSALALSAQEPLKSLPTKVRAPAAHLRLAQRDFLAPSSSEQQLLPRAPAPGPFSANRQRKEPVAALSLETSGEALEPQRRSRKRQEPLGHVTIPS